MSIMVKLNYVRHSARKLRPVTDMFIGTRLEKALNQTLIMPQDSARMVHQTLKMAKGAAEEKQFNSSDMVVTQIFATEGPKIKRSRANSRGRSNRYVKHLAHITVILDENKHETVVSSTPKPNLPKTKIETKVRSKRISR